MPEEQLFAGALMENQPYGLAGIPPTTSQKKLPDFFNDNQNPSNSSRNSFIQIASANNMPTHEVSQPGSMALRNKRRGLQLDFSFGVYDLFEAE